MQGVSYKLQTVTNAFGFITSIIKFDSRGPGGRVRENFSEIDFLVVSDYKGD